MDILSGTLLRSHAPALLSGIFIPILQRTNRLWLAAAAGAAGLHTGIRAGHHEKCGANRNRTSWIQLDPEGSSGRVGYKFRRLRVMQVCYLKPSDARPSRDGYYGCRSDIDGLSEDWQSGGDGIRAGQICWMCWSSGCFSTRYIKKKAQSFALSTFKWKKNGTLLQHWKWNIAVPSQQSTCNIHRHLSRLT